MYQLQIDGLQHHLVFQSQLIETGTRAAGIRACLGGGGWGRGLFYSSTLILTRQIVSKLRLPVGCYLRITAECE